MQRPNTVLGLTAHIARDRWQRLSTAGRVVLIVGAAFVSLGAMAGVHMAIGGACCHGACPTDAQSAPIAASSDGPCGR